MIEHLEIRKLLSVTLENGILKVLGDSADNTIVVEVNGSNISADDGINPEKTFKVSKVEKIIVRGKGDKDSISLFEMTQDIPSSIFGGGARDQINGGIGKDTIKAGGGNDVIDAGAGNDKYFGGPGDDTFQETITFPIPTGSGSDVFDGGKGKDMVDYKTRTATVKASIDGKKNDGQIGENDFIRDNVENITGGQANDVLKGSSKKNTLYGYAGADTIRGFGGNDTLIGDWITTIPSVAPDKLFGGNGNDFLDVDDTGHRDTVSGGAGNDTVDIDGFDHVVDAEVTQ